MFSYFLKQRIKKMQSESVRFSDSFQTYDKVCKILILCEYSAIETLLPYIDKIKQDRKDVTVFAIDTKKNKTLDLTQNIPDYIKVLNHSNFERYTHIPANNILKLLQQQTCDVMIDVTSELNYTIEYIAYIVNAPYKMGLKKKEINPYQFMIQGTQILSATDILENLLFYWKKIDIKNNNL